MRLKVEWLPNPRYADGGSWVLVKGNGSLFMEPAKKGRDVRTKKQLQVLAYLWNAYRSRAFWLLHPKDKA